MTNLTDEQLERLKAWMQWRGKPPETLNSIATFDQIGEAIGELLQLRRLLRQHTGQSRPTPED
jgi:hypothetical protein